MEEVELENLRLRVTKTVPAFEDGDGDGETPHCSLHSSCEDEVATQPSCPPGLEASHHRQEQRSSRVVRVGDTYSRILATRALELGHPLVVDSDVLLQTGVNR